MLTVADEYNLTLHFSVLEHVFVVTGKNVNGVLWGELSYCAFLFFQFERAEILVALVSVLFVCLEDFLELGLLDPLFAPEKHFAVARRAAED